MDAVEMIGRCMQRQDPNIPSPIPVAATSFEQVEGHQDSLARVADEGVVEDVRELQIEPACDDDGALVP